MDEEIKFEDDVKEKKPINPKIIIIVLGILVVILFILLIISYSRNSTLLKERNNLLSNKESSIEVIDVTDKAVQTTFSKYVTTISNYCRREKEYFTSTQTTATTLSNEVVYGVVMNKLVNIDKTGSNISKRTLREEIQKMFGSSYNFEEAKVNTYPAFKYDENSDTYVYDKSGSKFTPSVCDLYKIVKAYRKDDELYIYVRVLFATSTNGSVHYYSDYEHNEEITNLDRNSSGHILGNDNNFSKGGLYEMKFRADTGNDYTFEYSQPTR
ncbi:MAG: hypothetical protein IJI43_00855 [Bacilli bacterium]|nr:hypothetical protein [Bacilli bacterium]